MTSPFQRFNITCLNHVIFYSSPLRSSVFFELPREKETAVWTVPLRKLISFVLFIIQLSHHSPITQQYTNTPSEPHHLKEDNLIENERTSDCDEYVEERRVCTWTDEITSVARMACLRAFIHVTTLTWIMHKPLDEQISMEI